MHSPLTRSSATASQSHAYIDDVHIVGSVDDVLAARTALVDHLRQIELSVKPDNCSLLYFHRPHSPTHSLPAASCARRRPAVGR